MTLPKVTYIVTDAISAEIFLSRCHKIRYFQQQGFEISLIANQDNRLVELGRKEGIAVYGVPLLRKISPWTDLKTVFQLVRILRKIRPTIVNAGTPKAGLLGMLASWIARVPIRIYLLHGLRAETVQGCAKTLLYVCEWVAARCANHVVSVSQSLRDKYVELGLCRKERMCILGSGSFNGVEWKRFVQTSEKKRLANELRKKYAIPQDDFLIGFIGRVAKDKGIDDLIKSHMKITAINMHKVHLLIVGDIEDNDPPDLETLRIIQESSIIHMSGFVPNPEIFLGTFDLLAFPSYREGMGMVALEAGAAEIPVVGYRATGVVDAVVEGETGLLVNKADVDAFANAIQRYIDNPVLRKKHGKNGKERILKEFRSDIIFKNWAEFYIKCLQRNNLTLPVADVEEVVSSSGRAA